MHSRSAACVFGEARLISSTRSRFASLIRQRTHSRSVSAGAWTTVARLSAIRRIVSAADSTATACLSAASSIPSFEQRLGFVQDRGGDPLLRRLGDPPLARRRDHDHLVLYGVEADVGSPHVVVDDEIGAFAVPLLARALEAALALVGREADEHGAVAAPRGELD